MLVNFFREHYASTNRLPKPLIDQTVIQALPDYDWPGNVLGLQRRVERMLVMRRGNRITLDNARAGLEGRANRSPLSLVSDARLADVEKHVILETLRRYDGNRARAAKVLGIGHRTLVRKLQGYGDEVNV